MEMSDARRSSYDRARFTPLVVAFLQAASGGPHAGVIVQKRMSALLAFAALAGAAVAAQQGPAGITPRRLTDASYVFDAAEGQKLRVVVVARPAASVQRGAAAERRCARRAARRPVAGRAQRRRRRR